MKFFSKNFKTLSGKYLHLFPKLASALLLDKEYSNPIHISEEKYLEILDWVDEAHKVNKLRAAENKLNNTVDKIILITTGKCQSKCSYCYASDNVNTLKEHLTVDSIKKTNLNLENIKNITFFGGEPVLDLKNIKTIVDFISEQSNREINIHFVTGLYYSNKLFDELLEYFINNKNVYVQLSIDPLGEDGSYSRIYKNFSGEESRNFALSRLRKFVKTGINSRYSVHGVFAQNCDIHSLYNHHQDLINIGLVDQMFNVHIDTTNSSLEFLDKVKKHYIPYVDKFIEGFVTSKYKLNKVSYLKPFHLYKDYPLALNMQTCGDAASTVITQNGKFSGCTGAIGMYDKVEDLINTPTGLDKDYCSNCEMNNICNGLCYVFKNPSNCYLYTHLFWKYIELFCKFNTDEDITEFLVNNSVLKFNKIKGE